MKINTNVSVIYIIAFALVYAIAVYTPLHSDDFSYSLLSLDFTNHIAHYLSWSGRFIADYTSNILLHIEDYYVRSAINSLLIVVMIYFISALPYAATGSNQVKTVFPVIFMVFWCFNPNLGQSVFWIVGSANYSLTMLFVVSFLYFLLKWKDSLNKYKTAFLLFIGILAGCSNESASVALSFFCVLIIFISLLINKKNIISICLLCSGVFVGSALLILSPGNFNRAQDVSFQQWYSWPLLTRFLYHIEERMMYPLLTFGLIIALSFIFAAAIVFRDIKRRLVSNEALYSSAFFICSLTALISLAGSPYTPPRSWTGGFYFSLMSLSFVINYLAQNKSILTRSLYSLSIASLMLLFITSYYFVYHSYKSVSYQNKIRDAIVLNSRQSSIGETILPDFYFSKLLNANDRFDEFFNPMAFSKYYNINSVKLEKVDFDYSVIISGHVINNELQGESLLSLYYSDTKSFMPCTLSFALNGDQREFNADKSISLSIIFKNGESEAQDFKPSPVNINGRLYIGMSVYGININKIIKLVVKQENKTIGIYSLN